jgi:hypothetical protein
MREDILKKLGAALNSEDFAVKDHALLDAIEEIRVYRESYTLDPAKISKLGVYRIFWKVGGSSVASVGQMNDGAKWFAAANWTNTTVSTDWTFVDRIELLAEA